MIQYDDITAIKTERADNGIYLRWVKSKLSWYQSSPTSTATADDDTVILPNVGSGRWLKQNSTANVVQGLTSQILTTSTTVSAGTKNYCNTTSGAITVTLPATPPTGALVNIFAVAGTTFINKITLNPNSETINGVASNKEITILNDWIDLEYVTSFGWIIKAQANPNVLKAVTTGFSISNPVSLPNYTGIINYLGRQKNTVSYQNPTNVLNARQLRAVVTKFGIVSLIVPEGGQAGIVSNLFTGTLSTLDVQTRYNQTSDKYGGALWIDFLAGGAVKASSIQYSMTNTPSRWANERPRRILIYGANTFNVELVGGNQAQYYGITNQLQSPILWNGFTDLELIANLFDVSTAAEWTLLSSQYHRLLTVNAAKFYRHYIIMNVGENFTASSNGSIQFCNQLEFYGDVVAT